MTDDVARDGSVLELGRWVRQEGWRAFHLLAVVEPPRTAETPCRSEQAHLIYAPRRHCPDRASHARGRRFETRRAHLPASGRCEPDVRVH